MVTKNSNHFFMKNTYLYRLSICVLCFVLAACQKVVIDEDGGGEEVRNPKAIQFNITGIEQVSFGNLAKSRGTDVSSVCDHISLGLYKDEKLIKQVHQTKSDKNFGHLSIVVAEGVYKVVVLAHSGTKNPKMTDMQKISFNGKVTDTFYCCEELELKDGGAHNLALRRAVAMFRLIISDPIPKDVDMIRFYYTGGSSTFDAEHGVGSVNSRQVEMRTITKDMQGKSGVFDVYTFPRADSKLLKMQVTAHKSNKNVMAERLFDVEIERNMVSQYKGCFFGGEPEAGGVGNGTVQLNFYSEDEWLKVETLY